MVMRMTSLIATPVKVDLPPYCKIKEEKRKEKISLKLSK